MEKIKKSLERQEITKSSWEKILIFLIIAGIGAVFGDRIVSYIGPSFLWVSLILLVIMALFMWALAGITIFRSLVVTGTILSVLSIISLSYCGIEEKFQTADSALKSILGFGTLYSLGVFFKSLMGDLLGDKNAKDELGQKGALAILKEVNNNKFSSMLFLLYALFLGFFIRQLYQVMYSIYSSLCIFS